MEANLVAGDQQARQPLGLGLVGIVGWHDGGYRLVRPRLRSRLQQRARWTWLRPTASSDGRDAASDPDLFWALRGGGSFGVVITAIEYDLIELPEVFAGSAIYPADERTSEIVSRHREGERDLPVDVTSIVRFLHLPRCR